MSSEQKEIEITEAPPLTLAQKRIRQIYEHAAMMITRTMPDFYTAPRYCSKTEAMWDWWSATFMASAWNAGLDIDEPLVRAVQDILDKRQCGLRAIVGGVRWMHHEPEPEPSQELKISLIGTGTSASKALSDKVLAMLAKV